MAQGGSQPLEQYPPVVVNQGAPGAYAPGQNAYGQPYQPQGGYAQQRQYQGPAGGYQGAQGYSGNPAQPYGANPPPGSYPPPYQTGQAVIVMNQYDSMNPNFSEVPVMYKCPHCGNHGMTNTIKKSGTGTWLICIGLCAFGFFPFNYVPFCLDPCKDTEHLCPKCNNIVGRKLLLG